MKSLFLKLLNNLGYEIIPYKKIKKGSQISTQRYNLLVYENAKDENIYQKSQEDGNREKINNVWAKAENIEQVADYLLLINPSPSLILCHGTRNGFEQKILNEKCKCEIIGTEISSTASQFPMTIQWDFHKVKPEWINNVDMIYSNSLDHSHSPIECMKAWISCLKPNGILVIDKASDSDPHRVTDMDPFGITFDNLVMLILETFPEEVAIRRILTPKFHKENTSYHGILVVQKLDIK